LLAVACAEATAPVSESVYSLERLDNTALPAPLLVDYDIRVDLVADTLRLRADSTFIEVAILRGTWDTQGLVSADTAVGTYTHSGSSLLLLTAGAGLTRLIAAGDSLMLHDAHDFTFRKLR
jgi:hypothetical protein